MFCPGRRSPSVLTKFANSSRKTLIAKTPQFHPALRFQLGSRSMRRSSIDMQFLATFSRSVRSVVERRRIIVVEVLAGSLISRPARARGLWLEWTVGEAYGCFSQHLRRRRPGFNTARRDDRVGIYIPFGAHAHAFFEFGRGTTVKNFAAVSWPDRQRRSGRCSLMVTDGPVFAFADVETIDRECFNAVDRRRHSSWWIGIIDARRRGGHGSSRSRSRGRRDQAERFVRFGGILA